MREVLKEREKNEGKKSNEIIENNIKKEVYEPKKATPQLLLATIIIVVVALAVIITIAK